jgi:hypothetical protein
VPVNVRAALSINMNHRVPLIVLMMRNFAHKFFITKNDPFISMQKKSYIRM